MDDKEFIPEPPVEWRESYHLMYHEKQFVMHRIGSTKHHNQLAEYWHVCEILDEFATVYMQWTFTGTINMTNVSGKSDGLATDREKEWENTVWLKL